MIIPTHRDVFFRMQHHTLYACWDHPNSSVEYSEVGDPIGGPRRFFCKVGDFDSPREIMGEFIKKRVGELTEEILGEISKSTQWVRDGNNEYTPTYSSYPCPMCGEKKIHKLTFPDYVTRWEGIMIRIKDATWRECGGCGEKLYNAEELERWSSIVKQIRKKEEEKNASDT